MPSAHTEEKEVVARTSKKGSCVKLPPFDLLAEVMSPCGKSSHIVLLLLCSREHEQSRGITVTPCRTVIRNYQNFLGQKLNMVDKQRYCSTHFSCAK